MNNRGGFSEIPLNFIPAMQARVMNRSILSLLRIFLALVAFHSIGVGLGLILIPLDRFGFFGFEGYQGNFFKIQAGVFHLVMCLAYVPAAVNPLKNRLLIRFAILAKFTATLFLFAYAALVEMVWMVLVSGILDSLMGGILLWLNHRLPEDEKTP